ncbi:ABC-F family ATP-binding cassette domain-containing protein [Polycladomyces subterraneus]|uniref:ABC-F family ATP-binding cassette domain-containing protein n=1 Tax=Polycladomyces subterraneus TaxID=1016997 RepID=A0ABT8IP51_9BACL|nr:ABC-F family ATP-binding cassette domain-containing protein [Polycladomyces subterraneus]MDN4594522.1 ABC-F family ATP-binding cassette domain-containing protein [Polycladomyces subterraneus]
MVLLQAKGIEKSFGATTVLRCADLMIREKERIGLIGVNGAGKSTLVKILIGQIPPDSGELHLAKNARIGYLAQDAGLVSERTMWDEMLSVFEHVRDMERELRRMEKEMGSAEVLSNPARYQQIMDQYAALQSRFEEAGGYGYEARIRGALHGLGLADLPWMETRCSALSGGQKTRLALAKLLLEEPDLLILDEPTNYLDMNALAWLEQTLANYPGALLVISHDRYFLDRFAQTIYEIEQGRTMKYVGNYTDYVRQKEAMLAQLEKAYEQQQEEIRKMEEFIRRNIARASTSKRAQSRQKALEKMERIEKPFRSDAAAAIRFEASVTSGRQVLQVENLCIGYDSATPLARNLTFQLERGERVALIGPNGTGKTTLLKTIAGMIAPLDGNIRMGTSIIMDFYDQEQEELDLASTVLDELWNAHPELNLTQIRTALGQFLFQGDDVYKQVKELSGGEKARLSLAKRMLNRANFLLMDEPTNHLDMRSKERLEEALSGYTGTLLFVSHDRYFINRLATRILELSPDGVRSYPGNYDDYLAKRIEETAESVQNDAKPAEAHREENRKKRQEERRRQQMIARLEQEIEELEQQRAKIHEQLCQPDVYTDPEESRRLQEELERVETALNEKTEEWADLAE